MNLIKQKNGILAIAKNEVVNIQFPVISYNQDTYFISYNESKHMEQTIMSYNSEVRDIREYLDYMWKNSSNESYTKEILSAVYECKDNQVGMLETIDLHNYMM